eukprot:5921098-Karenia_brevis.AAC.1
MSGGVALRGQVEPSWGQVGPKMGPTWAKLQPSWAQSRPSWEQVGPSWLLNTPPNAAYKKHSFYTPDLKANLGQVAAKLGPVRAKL